LPRQVGAIDRLDKATPRVLGTARPMEFDSEGNLAELLVPVGELLTH